MVQAHWYSAGAAGRDDQVGGSVPSATVSEGYRAAGKGREDPEVLPLVRAEPSGDRERAQSYCLGGRSAQAPSSATGCGSYRTSRGASAALRSQSSGRHATRNGG